MDRLFMFIATGGYSGYLPKAPGTWGSLVGVFLWFFLCHLPLTTYLVITGILFVIGVASAGAAEKIVDRGDPGLVVIDEIVGQLITLSIAPFGIIPALAGFVLFRIFDIIKPFPINWFDSHIHGGLGIMFDDVIAGLYGLLILAFGLWILG
ncbi:phosphatidylglycerophosphatase A family protein [Desulfogranum japonicum]|uniref:phosphatidylglycerophosphatase A family protein n=1 Tax=Desulfogranum japonicum TaxID=231447 RepID=UPI00041F55AC|nr:phosphatidylglycerophosphatase A [Desulfogranum japonicum]